MKRRVVLIVMDSVGVGALPDAAYYGDSGSHTIGNIIKKRGKLHIPNLYRLGLGNIDGVDLPIVHDKPVGCYGKAAEASAGKDTTTGHWEIAGIILKKPFPTYPNGFPEEIIQKFELRINRHCLGNITASGTEIIKEMGEEHMRTGYPIVYTSADSVFQIAAHEDIIPLEELYKQCQIAREILQGEHAVGRVIARPFKGQPGNFFRTANRKDFSISPPENMLLNTLQEAGHTVTAVGKIQDIFNNQGITMAYHTTCNKEGIEKTLDILEKDFQGLLFTNLVDFDMVYGHRNDVQGYAEALEEFDSFIPTIMESLREDDILIITADHGCDPTTESTDHSREYIPILVWGRKLKQNVNLGIRKTYSDIGATIAQYLHAKPLQNGTSFLDQIL